MFTVTIETDNDAFGYPSSAGGISLDGINEVCRLLKEVQKRVKDGDERGQLRDYNGNTVGSFEWKD